MRTLSIAAVVTISICLFVLNVRLVEALPNNVTNSKHNFGYNPLGNYPTTQFVGDIEEVCKYCHTPHNAGSSSFLWNKANRTGASYRMYTSSRTLTRATVNGTFTADSPSLLCLGCHDGKTAMNVLHTSSIGGAPAGAEYPAGTTIVPTGGGSLTPKTIESVAELDFFSGLPTGVVFSYNLGEEGADPLKGDNLTNDHPVGFSYQAVYDERSTGLYSPIAVGTNSGGKIRFFGPDKRLECSSCHNPHADNDDVAVKPFLVMDNSGSALCLSCHNK